MNNFYISGLLKKTKQIPHLLPIALMTVLFLIIQIHFLRLKPLYFIYPDSDSYINLAKLMQNKHIFTDTNRTSGYPLFIFLNDVIAGSVNYKIIVLSQSILMLIAAIEIYFISLYLTKNNYISLVAGLLAASNLYILSWERYIITEPVAYFCLVTTLFSLCWYLKKKSKISLSFLIFFCAYLVLVRPNYIFIPPLIFIFLISVSLMEKSLKKQWNKIILFITCVSFLVGLNVIGNVYYHHVASLSEIENRDLIGKILEYKMQDETSMKQFTKLKLDLDHYSKTGNDSPNIFLTEHPEYFVNNSSLMGKYSTDIISHHLFQYIQNTIPDFEQLWLSAPSVAEYVPFSPITNLAFYTEKYIYYFSYTFIPFAIVIKIIQFYKRRRIEDLVMILFVLSLICNVFLVVFGNEEQFIRLRFPVDWIAITVAVLTIPEMFHIIIKGSNK